MSVRSDLSTLLQRLEHAPAVLVSVHAVQGSVPRDAGAWMAVFADGAVGTIGGGHLEWQACAWARERLQQVSVAEPGLHTVVLGPSLGQCCGGRVQLRLESVSAADVARLRLSLQPGLAPVALFGGGHVGSAIVRALLPLPFEIHWTDSRDGVFPPDLAGLVHTETSDPVQAQVRHLPPGARVLIMSFSHAEDLDVVAACLERRRARGDLPFVGLIGSLTKWATFRRRLGERGYINAELDAVTCPIGLPGIDGKQPEVIAASVAAQLLLLPTPLPPQAGAGA